jgi:hypothetical protein
MARARVLEQALSTLDMRKRASIEKKANEAAAAATTAEDSRNLNEDYKLNTLMSQDPHVAQMF